MQNYIDGEWVDSDSTVIVGSSRVVFDLDLVVAAEVAEAVDFLRQLNTVTHDLHPGTVMMAEESSPS